MIGQVIIARSIAVSEERRNCRETWSWRLFLLEGGWRASKFFQTVLVSGVQHSEAVIHINISTLFKIFFAYRPLQSIE